MAPQYKTVPSSSTRPFSELGHPTFPLTCATRTGRPPSTPSTVRWLGRLAQVLGVGVRGAFGICQAWLSSAVALLPRRRFSGVVGPLVRSGQVRSGQVRSGQVRFITRPKSRTMRVKRKKTFESQQNVRRCPMSNELESDGAMVMNLESFQVGVDGVGYDETETEPPSSTNPQ